MYPSSVFRRQNLLHIQVQLLTIHKSNAEWSNEVEIIFGENKAVFYIA